MPVGPGWPGEVAVNDNPLTLADQCDITVSTSCCSCQWCLWPERRAPRTLQRFHLKRSALVEIVRCRLRRMECCWCDRERIFLAKTNTGFVRNQLSTTSRGSEMQLVRCCC